MFKFISDWTLALHIAGWKKLEKRIPTTKYYTLILNYLVKMSVCVFGIILSILSNPIFAGINFAYITVTVYAVVFGFLAPRVNSLMKKSNADKEFSFMYPELISGTEDTKFLKNCIRVQFCFTLNSLLMLLLVLHIDSYPLFTCVMILLIFLYNTSSTFSMIGLYLAAKSAEDRGSE